MHLLRTAGTTWPVTRSTSTPNGVFIHPAIWPQYTANSSRFETLLIVPKWCFEPLTVVLAPHLVIRGTNYRVIVRNGVRTAALQSLETPLMDSHHRCIQNWKRACGNTSNGVEDHSCRDMGRFLNPMQPINPTHRFFTLSNSQPITDTRQFKNVL